MQIVLARLVDDCELVKRGRDDLGERHTFRAIKRAESLMWLSNGTPSDKSKAKVFADQEGYRVFCFQNERDPLNRAKMEIVGQK